MGLGIKRVPYCGHTGRVGFIQTDKLDINQKVRHHDEYSALNEKDSGIKRKIKCHTDEGIRAASTLVEYHVQWNLEQQSRAAADCAVQEGT